MARRAAIEVPGQEIVEVPFKRSFVGGSGVNGARNQRQKQQTSHCTAQTRNLNEPLHLPSVQLNKGRCKLKISKDLRPLAAWQIENCQSRAFKFHSCSGMSGLFISFEGTEGSGKSTQLKILAERLRAAGHSVRQLREPGGTPIGEEIRHTLKHSEANAAMTAEAELLLMNASRAQLVREVIRPALAAGETVLCDRFYDSTTAYQGYGRQLNLPGVQASTDFAVEETRPHLTLLLEVPIEISEARRASRQARLLDVPPAVRKARAALAFDEPLRDRIEEADRAFFERVHKGYQAIAAAEPKRVRVIDATQSIESVSAEIWRAVSTLIPPKRR